MLELKNIQKRYDYHKVLQDIDMSFPGCGMVSIVGPSGCGKSTLLHIIGGIDQDFLGDLLWQGKSVKKHLTKYRRQHVSFIFQQFHLIDSLLPLHRNYITVFVFLSFLLSIFSQVFLEVHLKHLP